MALEGGNANSAAKETEATPPRKMKAYGAELSGVDAVSVHDLLANRHSYVDKAVQVAGTVVGVCAKRGCWIEIGGNDGESLRFKVEDGEMIFPVSAKGSVVRAEGVWTKIYYSIEELRTMRAERAAEAGEEFDPETVTEPYLAWQLKGVGAEIDA